MYVCYSENKLFGESGLRLEHKLLRQTRCLTPDWSVRLSIPGDSDLRIHIVYTLLPE